MAISGPKSMKKTKKKKKGLVNRVKNAISGRGGRAKSKSRGKGRGRGKSSKRKAGVSGAG